MEQAAKRPSEGMENQARAALAQFLGFSSKKASCDSPEGCLLLPNLPLQSSSTAESSPALVLLSSPTSQLVLAPCPAANLPTPPWPPPACRSSPSIPPKQPAAQGGPQISIWAGRVKVLQEVLKTSRSFSEMFLLTSQGSQRTDVRYQATPYTPEQRVFLQSSVKLCRIGHSVSLSYLDFACTTQLHSGSHCARC